MLPDDWNLLRALASIEGLGRIMVVSLTFTGDTTRMNLCGRGFAVMESGELRITPSGRAELAARDPIST